MPFSVAFQVVAVAFTISVAVVVVVAVAVAMMVNSLLAADAMPTSTPTLTAKCCKQLSYLPLAWLVVAVASCSNSCCC